MERQEKHLHVQAVVGEELLVLEDVPGGDYGRQEPIARVAEVRELTVCAEAVVDLGANSLCATIFCLSATHLVGKGSSVVL